MVDRQDSDAVQAACERGQEQLIATDYLAAAATLAGAEAAAWAAGDWDALARLYMPLQEARRQARLRAGEGAVAAVVADSADEADAILDRCPQGQLLVAGPAVAAAVRRRAAERQLYVEALIATIGPTDPPAVIYPFADSTQGGIAVRRDAWPATVRRGTPQTFAAVSALWDRLHGPFLAAAEAEPDPVRRMAAFRRTIAVDPACELAHQHLSHTARELGRQSARAAIGGRP